MWAALIPAVATIAGSLLSSNANKKAADQATQAQADSTAAQIEANREARAEYRAAADRGVGAIRAGTQRYADTINPLLTPNPVGLEVYRGLTPAQQIGRQDMLRQGQAALAASGLRGAGRAGVGTILDADRRYVASAADKNDEDQRTEMRRAQGSADSARRGLASIYAQEGGSIANTEIGAGNRIGESVASDGTAAAQGARTSGLIQGQATTANGQIYGQAIGAIGSLVADATKYRNADGMA